MNKSLPEQQEEQPSIFEIFSKYASDNREILSIVGVIAAVTALFLNLDPLTYSSGLKGLQIILLLFLILSIMFLAIGTFWWFKRNNDSYFGGLVSFTFGLFIWRLLVFITENFRNELNQYLGIIIFSVILIVGTFLYRTQQRVEHKFIENKVIGPLMCGIGAFIFMYLLDSFFRVYLDFANNKVIQIDNFIVPLKKFRFVYLIIAIWTVTIELYFRYSKDRKRWLKFVILSPILFIGFYIIFIAI